MREAAELGVASAVLTAPDAPRTSASASAELPTPHAQPAGSSRDA